MAKSKNLVVVLVALLISTAALGAIPSAPFVAINAQGRPLVGGSVSVTDGNGTPVVVYSNPAGTIVYPGIVPASGIVQFFGAAGEYIVTVSSQGTTRTYYLSLPVASGGLADSNFPSYGGWMRKISANTYTAVKVNLAAVTNPTTSDDSTQDYSVGSIWVNVLTDDIYFCTDPAAGGAIWRTIGAALTSINSQTGPAITLTTGSTGTDLAISNPVANTLSVNIPSMTGVGITRGLLTNTTQSLPGVKTFTNTAFFTSNIQVNTGLSSTSSTFNTSGYFGALNIDGTNDQVTFFDTAAAASGINTRLYAASDTTDTVLTLSSNVGGHGISATSVGAAGGGSAGMFTAGAASTGNGIEADSMSANARAAVFIRSVASSIVPVTAIRRNVATDAQPLLGLEDLTATTTATYAMNYALNSVIKNGLRTNGQVVATQSATIPAFALIDDPDSGFSGNAGIPVIVDEGAVLGTFTAAGIVLSGASDISLLSSNTLGLTAAAISLTGPVTLSGQIIGPQSASVPILTLSGDLDSGFGGSTGTPKIFDEGTLIASFDTASVAITGTTAVSIGAAGSILLSATNLNFTGDAAITGELFISGVTGAGKAVCVKADTNLGVCADAPDVTGVCTCG